jgi:hypothetical protein
VIRVQADPIGDGYNVMILVQGNKRTRSEIKGVNTFKEIETLLNDNFKRHNDIFDIAGGQVSIEGLQKIVNKLSSLKIDEKNNWFTL